MTPVHPGDHSSAALLRDQEAIEQSMCFGRSIRWSALRIAGVEISVAMSLPLGLFAAIAFGVSAHLSDNASASSWAPAAQWMGWLIGSWALGLMVQTGIAVGHQRIAKVHRGGCIVTAGGVWTAPTQRPHGISVSGVLMIWSLCMLALGLGSLSLIGVSFLTMDAPRSGGPIVWLDDPWAAAAWLWCLQGIWNLLPLPQSLGRVGWALVFALFGGGPQQDPRACLRAMRAWVIAMALLTLIGGNVLLHSSGVISQAGGLAWPAVAGVVALSLWLFTSAGSSDLTAIYESIVRRAEYTEVGEQNPIGRFRGQFGPMASWRRYQVRRQDAAQQQRLREAMAREHREADDASRVDEILQRLHRDGVDSLADDERELLQRVSLALKNERRSIERDVDDKD
ncbi:AAA family ATPase [Rhodopirellula islandica]|uniref:hypothetical protein n=1 Tax=Rhodopirellula islandica TaxID=595434 RepID=UPI000649CF25|nr:hypothetical protein [Rhodopirellula islandica]